VFFSRISYGDPEVRLLVMASAVNGNRLPENEWKSISIRIDPAIQLSAASICMLFATPSK